MRLFILFFFVGTILCSQLNAADSPSQGNNDIVITGEIYPGTGKSIITLRIIPVEHITYVRADDVKTIEQPIKRHLKWAISTESPVYVYGSFLGEKYRLFCLAEPGDNINVSYMDNRPVFTGRGAAKFELAYHLVKLDDSLNDVSHLKEFRGKEYNSIKSTNDFFSWNQALNIKMGATVSLIDSYKDKISTYAYNVIKEQSLYPIEKIRLYKFQGLIDLSNPAKKKKQDILSQSFSNESLCKIYDSTVNGFGGNWMRFESPVVDDPYYLYYRIEFDILRQQGKFYSENGEEFPRPKDRIDKYVSRYYWVKKNYQPGKVREELLAFFFHYVRGLFFNFGFDPKVEALLKDYYATPGFPEYKSAVRKYELERRAKLVGNHSIDFSFSDRKDQAFKKAELKGKVAILDFWFTGCSGCIQMTPALKKLEEHYKMDSNVVFVSVSIDKDKAMWQLSIRQKKYTTGSAINLYTGGEGKDHEMIRNYGIEGYPHLIVFDPQGKMQGRYQDFDPRKDEGKRLKALIDEQLVEMNDGPYVFYDKGVLQAVRIHGAKVEQLSEKKLAAQTDKSGQKFEVQLQRVLQSTPVSYDKPEKLIAFSDIEGNFDQLRKLLQSNKVIDENYNWIFGKGHLVFAGDMFDRGNQVTECLWLLYSLEEKAKAEGGLVHFVLGNHEIMNLQGDHRYVEPKYKDNAELLGRSLTDIYGEDSELGRWLRNKNIVERIGDLLFLHGGISRKMNNSTLNLEQLNLIARPNYEKRGSSNSNDSLVKIIFDPGTSPFWYRSYYTENVKKKIEVEKMIDSTLEKFNVRHIVTGHTVVADTISVHYNGKVINTDTKHASGKSEALLIEGDHFYRVNSEGKRVLLFIDDKKKITTYKISAKK